MAVSNAADKAVDADVITIDRRSSDRRQKKNPNATASGGTNPPRRKKQRRRHIDPTTCERDYNIDEIEFMRAMDDYKRDSGRMFPTCSEVLEVIRALGYVKLSDEQAAQFRVDASDCDAESDEAADLGEPSNS